MIDDKMKRLETFIQMKDRFAEEKERIEEEIGSFTGEEKEMLRDWKDRLEICLSHLPNAEVFEVEPDLAELFLETDNEVRKENLPFPVTFIDTKFEGIKGVLLIQTGESYSINALKSLDDKDITASRKCSHCYKWNSSPINKESDFNWKESHNKNAHSVILGWTGKETYAGGKLMDDYREWHALRKERKKTLELFATNFLDFINSPDVEWEKSDEPPEPIKEKGYSPCPVCDKRFANPRAVDNHMKREHPDRRFPESRTAKLKGRTKKYVREYGESGIERKKIRKHWVRGHWRHLKSDFYTNKQGETIWVPPHTRGEGVLARKKYRLES